MQRNDSAIPRLVREKRQLTSGTYFMKSLELNKKAKLRINIVSGVPVIINIIDDLVFGK